MRRVGALDAAAAVAAVVVAAAAGEAARAAGAAAQPVEDDLAGRVEARAVGRHGGRRRRRRRRWRWRWRLRRREADLGWQLLGRRGWRRELVVFGGVGLVGGDGDGLAEEREAQRWLWLRWLRPAAKEAAERLGLGRRRRRR